MDDATQKLVDGLRQDAGDYAVHMAGVPKSHDLSWDARNVRAWEAADALEAAQRPPVSSEAREEMKSVLHEAMHKGAYSLGEQLDDLIDALLARFTVSSQPVYDEKAIARWLRENHDPCITEGGCNFGYPDYRHDAAALVAALRAGELS